jgi:hypothetical protein
VIGRPSPEIAANRRPDHHRTGELVVGSVPQHRHLVAHLHHGGPDVVEELNFDDRLDAAHGQADTPANDAGFGQRRVENTRGTERSLESVGDFEDATLAGH